MTEFVNFCREYGVYILSFLCILFEIIILIIKRKPQSIDDFLYCLNEVRAQVADLCSLVEIPGNGEVKKNTVIKRARMLLEAKLGRSITDKETAILDSFVSKDIEAVLKAPQKKEIK